GHGQLRLFDDARRVVDCSHRLIRLVLRENRDRAVTQAATELEAHVWLVEAEVVLVAPEPCGNLLADSLKPIERRLQTRIVREKATIRLWLANRRERRKKLVM